jgi:alpha-L-rhamnosidase
VWPVEPRNASATGQLPEQRRTAALRTTFELENIPLTAPARIAAIGRCSWWVNGIEIGRGPVRSNPQRQPWDDADIADALRLGTNHVALLVTFEPNASAWSMPLPKSTDLSRGAVAFEAQVGPDTWVASDANWVGQVLNGWTADAASGITARGAERIDARSLDVEWATQSASSLSWTPVRCRRAFVFGASGRANPPSFPVGPIHQRPISRPTTTVIPLRCVAASTSGTSSTSTFTSTFTADRVVVGTLRVEVEGKAGLTVRVQTSERVNEAGLPKQEHYDPAVTITLDGSRRWVETVDIFGLRAATIESQPGVIVHNVEVIERLHPVTGDSATSELRFQSSSALLNDIFAAGRRTVSICSLDSYVDCPSREQRAWTGDSVVHQLVDLTTNNDWTLARWHPHLAASPRADGMLPMAVAGDIEANDLSIIPDWALHWVHSVWNLYRYVGDKSEIAGLLATVEGVLRWFLPFCDSDGVPVDVPGWVIIDWSSVYSDGKSSTIAGLWGRALLEFAEMAAWVGDLGRASWALETHARLRVGFEGFWDENRGRYVDTIVNGDRQPMCSQHGQAAAIVGGMAPPERWDALVSTLTNEPSLIHATFSRADGPANPGSETELGGNYLATGHPAPWWDTDRLVVRAQPFFRYVVHDALVAVGRGDLIAGLLQDWQWLLDRCSTSLSETWYGGTTSHGWSSTPTRDLIQHVLGITPAEPGFICAQITPHLGNLDWIEAAVPTPFGTISARVDQHGVTAVSPIPVRVNYQGKSWLIQASAGNQDQAPGQPG